MNKNKLTFLLAIIFLFLFTVKFNFEKERGFPITLVEFRSVIESIPIATMISFTGDITSSRGASICKEIVEYKLKPLIEDLRKEQWDKSIITADMKLLRDWYACTYLYKGGNTVMEVQKWVDNQGMSEMDIAVNIKYLSQTGRNRRLKTWKKLGIVHESLGNADEVEEEITDITDPRYTGYREEY